MKNLFLLFLLLTIISSCGQRSPISDNEYKMTSSYIVGGDSKENHPLSTTVTLNNGHCSGVKVGKNKILTAAHCLYSEGTNVYLNYFPGYKNIITNHLGNSKEYPVKNTFIHKTYTDEVQRIEEGKSTNEEASISSYDIALIEFYEEIKDVNTAVLNLTDTNFSNSLVITGGGKELNKDGRFVDSQKIKSAFVDQIQIEDIDEVFLEEYKSEKIDTYYLLTLGSMSNSNKASLAPGDSGGGIFFGNKLIGINSFSAHLVPVKTYFHAHTRLADLQVWLEDLL